ncbi:hypothetical protein FEA44_02995 [Mannheimia haemolytica]|uniref:Uncharacterized protein n=1 Tax=Mannheimia haemolytica TaxID=75985 RepID=A0A547EDC8_MANHA|nr:hypothetical protein FEB90_03010 [Mannheimia haemolytica]TRB36161.1 hypothetical protein FEB95_03005 [Mannheimia haemolytica]TRB39605.1 hypothetical protein FEB89_02990 [Mannheimia haemolytica]TRB47771.1 hypothetical protein FEA87_04290 [Mannheimia haemolytica]TRB49944.1 hypothetical protein FEB92_02270 [Mannheimia haemolytica]
MFEHKISPFLWLYLMVYSILKFSRMRCDITHRFAKFLANSTACKKITACGKIEVELSIFLANTT